MKSAIWITWEYQPRNITISSKLGVKLYQLDSTSNRLLKYTFFLCRTFWILFKERPKVVFAQNPSIVLSLMVVFLQVFFKYKSVIDEHSAGIFPLEGESKILNRVAKWIVAHADYVIVTNDSMANVCKSWKGRPFVLPDPLPENHDFENLNFGDEEIFVMVSTWAKDEPVKEVIEAFSTLQNLGVKLKITGKPPESLDLKSLPSNVYLTGYLSNQEYYQLLGSTSGVIVLTYRDDCLNCGAYEAVAYEVPGILSSRAVLKEYFNKGFIFTNNQPEDIAKKVIELLDRKNDLKGEVSSLKRELKIKDRSSVQSLSKALGLAEFH